MSSNYSLSSHSDSYYSKSELTDNKNKYEFHNEDNHEIIDNINPIQYYNDNELNNSLSLEGFNYNLKYLNNSENTSISNKFKNYIAKNNNDDDNNTETNEGLTISNRYFQNKKISNDIKDIILNLNKKIKKNKQYKEVYNLNKIINKKYITKESLLNNNYIVSKIEKEISNNNYNNTNNNINININVNNYYNNKIDNNTNLDNLYLFLKSLFLNNYNNLESLEKIYSKLNTFELNIINYIIKRKFLKKLDIQKNITLKQICEYFKTSLKRQEENYKFSLKKAIKNLQFKFKKSNNKIFKNKNTEEREFYLSYFKDYCKKNNFKIENFFFPKNIKKSFDIPRSVNEKYFEYISISKLFVKDLIYEVENNIIDIYKKVIDQKIKSFIIKLGNLNEDNKIKQYILENTKCKFPWSSTELNMSVNETLRKLIEYYKK